MPEYLAWGYGHPVHEPDGLGIILTVTTDPARRDAIVARAHAEGFQSVTVSEFHQGDRPDFAGALNV